MLALQSSVLDGCSARFRLGGVIPALLGAFAAILGDLSQARLGSRRWYTAVGTQDGFMFAIPAT